MKETSEKEIQRIRKLLLPVFKKKKARKAYLFGSFAKGTQSRKSDVDLMIITETDKRFFDRYDDYEEIQRVLGDRSVDMLIYTSDELERISHRVFIKGIIEKGEVIYEC
jgi:predicted nucleotidyltransferase